MFLQQFCAVLILAILFFNSVISSNQEHISAIGDPGMRRDSLRVAIEAWNQCNEVGEEAPEMGSPRQADCFDIDNSTSPSELPYFYYISLSEMPRLAYS